MLSGHQLHVWSAVFSPDGSAIATASSDQTLRLWDARTFAPIAIDHGHDSEVWCAAFSPDGNLLATGGKDQLIQLWPARPHAKQRALPNDNSFIPSLSPDGKWLAAFDPVGGDAVLLNASNGSVALRRPLNAGPFVGFSPDGENAVAIDDGTLVFLDPRSGQTVRQTKLQGPGPVHGPFVCAGMSSDQAFLFCIDTNGGIRVWDTASGALAASAAGPAPPIRNAILSPDARHLALSVERENCARLYNFSTGSALELAGHRDFVSGLAFSPDSATLATGSMDGSIRLWDTRRGRPLAVLPGHMQETTDLAFSPDGRTLASVGAQESLKLWHVPTRRELVSQSMPHAGHWLRFSADGTTLAVENDSDQILLLSAPPGQN
jgi:WD40 repeat protein